MSYCRFSTNAFRCDVYAYSDVAGGYTIHVAARKRLVPEDFPDPLEEAMKGINDDPEGAMARYNTLNAEMNAFPLVELTAPSAGQIFRRDDLESFHAKMLELRGEGLRFPDEVLEWIESEMRDQDATPTPN